MLAGMCMVPVITILTLWQIMPPAEEDTLQVNVTRVGVPALEYYFDDIADRKDVQQSYIVVKNESENEWSHVFVKVNKNYDIRDDIPIPPDGERSYLLNRFVSRTGARYDLRQLPLRHVRIFAKQEGKGSRATCNIEFANMIKTD